MILIHIIPQKNSHAEEIVDLLLEKKLILNAMIEKSIVVREQKKGNIQNTQRTLILGKTKGLLFNTIDELLKDKYGKEMPYLYALPIVHMDWEQAEELMEETEKV